MSGRQSDVWVGNSRETRIMALENTSRFRGGVLGIRISLEKLTPS